MAQIVLIDTGTLNIEVNAIDDIVEIQANNVDLTGPGYADYRYNTTCTARRFEYLGNYCGFH